MITFLISLIHPKHKYISSYNDILCHLKRTLDNLRSIGKRTKIIVVCHQKPKWHQEYASQVVFIVVSSILFEILSNLDCQEIKSSSISQFDVYTTYLGMGGKYHNKDKGLKYYIGLLYLKYLQEKPKFICIMDGDDFIHPNIQTYLSQQAKHYNQFFIRNGFLLFTKGKASQLKLEDVYPITGFSQICGSNRFYRYKHFQEVINRYLQYELPNPLRKRLVAKFQFNEKAIFHLMGFLKKNPLPWTLLPRFLGVHRPFSYNDSTHPIQFEFHTQFISFYAGAKLIHENNHCAKSHKIKKKEILKKYLTKNMIFLPLQSISPKWIRHNFNIQDIII